MTSSGIIRQSPNSTLRPRVTQANKSVSPVKSRAKKEEVGTNTRNQTTEATTNKSAAVKAQDDPFVQKAFDEWLKKATIIGGKDVLPDRRTHNNNASSTESHKDLNQTQPHLNSDTIESYKNLPQIQHRLDYDKKETKRSLDYMGADKVNWHQKKITEGHEKNQGTLDAIDLATNRDMKKLTKEHSEKSRKQTYEGLKKPLPFSLDQQSQQNLTPETEAKSAISPQADTPVNVSLKMSENGHVAVRITPKES